MKWTPSGVGAEPKKLAILGILLAGSGVAYYFSSRSDVPPPQAERVAQATLKTTPPSGGEPSPAPSPNPTPMPAHRTAPRNAGVSDRVMADFHPTLKLEEGFDVSKIDPTLRLELLARLQKVPLEGSSRSLFEFGKAPEPAAPKVTINPKPAAAEVKAPESPNDVKPADPPKPPPPPIPLKFYGYAGTTRDGIRRAFFLDGDDIYTPAENETVKGRYKIVRIGVNSAVVEDIPNKNQQTLPLVEELGG